jgi:hypothetical protein
MTPGVSAGAGSQKGPLLEVYRRAKAKGSLAFGNFEEIVKQGGAALAGSDDPVLVLLDQQQSDPPGTTSRLEPLRFEGSEHTAIGNGVILRFSADDKGLPASEVPLAFRDDLSLTYGQIVALGGDFYGIPDQPISEGKRFPDRQQRFTACYESLAHGSLREMKKILRIMQREIDAVKNALDHGLSVSAVYDEFGNELNKAWNVATGGGSDIFDLVPPGRYLELATKNWDHFGQWAVLAYKAGHAVALSRAAEAYHATTPAEARKRLMEAYAMNAFADHFLTDLFSAGHLREPRREIYETSYIGAAANLCAKGMHDEDSKYGLKVSNRAGDKWTAYGDKRYFDSVNRPNKIVVDRAIQVSVTEIFQAFTKNPKPIDPDDFGALRLAPNLDELHDHHGNPLKNFVPMFVVENGKVKCRTDLNDLDTPDWTDGWTTVEIAGRLNSPLYDPTRPTHRAAAAAAPLKRRQPAPAGETHPDRAEPCRTINVRIGYADGSPLESAAQVDLLIDGSVANTARPDKDGLLIFAVGMKTKGAMTVRLRPEEIQVDGD